MCADSLKRNGLSWAHPEFLIEVTDLLFSACVFVHVYSCVASCTLQFSVFLGLIFFLELTAGILAFVFKDWIKDQLNFFINNNVKAYRDDIDLQNLIDFAQEYVSPHLLPETRVSLTVKKERKKYNFHVTVHVSSLEEVTPFSRYFAVVYVSMVVGREGNESATAIVE